jgi:hypothetical protein
VHPIMDGHPHRYSTDFEQTLLGGPLGYVTVFGEAGVCVFITAGPSTKLFAWGGGGDIGRSKFGATDNLFLPSNSIPPYLRTTEPTSSRQPTVSAATANLAEAPPRSPAPVSTASTEGRSAVGV